MVLKSKITKKVIRNPNDEELLKKLKIKKEYFPETNEIFYIVLLNNNEIGSAVYRTNTNVVDSVGIDGKYKRRGVATWLYDFIEKDQKIKLTPSKTLMREGMLFWRNRLRKSNPRDEEFLKFVNIEKFTLNSDIIYLLTINDFKTEVGIVTYNPRKKIISDIHIEKEFQRKGVATFIYDYIEKDQNVKLKSSVALLPDGKKFWENRLKKNPFSKLEPKNARPLKTSKTKIPR